MCYFFVVQMKKQILLTNIIYVLFIQRLSKKKMSYKYVSRNSVANRIE